MVGGGPRGFWDAVRAFFDVLGDGFEGPALADATMPGASWYPLARLNLSESVLRRAADPATREEVAVREVLEGGPGRTLTWGDLEREVHDLAEHLRSLGVVAGDRVAAVLPNVPEALVGLLAAASVGAVWAVASPDLAPAVIAGRMAQLEPTVLIATTGYDYAGRHLDLASHLADVRAALPSVRHVVLVGDGAQSVARADDAVVAWPVLRGAGGRPRYERLPFDHPLWVLFSSGTTGTPKGIVHGHGGILLEGLKLSGLHCDVGPSETCFVAASTSWMVWNLMVMDLAAGGAVVTYPGSPPHTT